MCNYYGNYYGFNPGVSNAIMGLQMATASVNGVTNALRAKNQGATTEQAVFRGLGTTFTGMGNAMMGNAINFGTGSYFGTLFSSFSPGVSNYPSIFGNPFAMNPFMTNTFGFNTFAMTPFVMNPFGFNMFGCCSGAGKFGF